jgi:hypothetical protein
MATNQQEKATPAPSPKTTEKEETSTTAPERTVSGEGYTITIPSFRNVKEGMKESAAGQAIEPKHLVWFGSLAVVGAAGIIEWPVVAAIGVGSYVAERFARSANQRHHRTARTHSESPGVGAV